MTLAHPERFPTLDLGAKGPIGRVTVVCRTARSSADALQARFEAAELAGYARQAPQTQVHLLPSPAQAIGLAARIERLALTAPDVVVVPDAGQPSASTQRLLQAIAKGLPQALLVYAREDGLEGQAAQALGSYHYLLTGDTGPGLVALLGHLAGSGGDPTQLAGLVWRDAQGELHTNPAWHSGSDLPEGPLPAWDLLADSTGSTLAIRTSRACAADCPTCHGAFGRTLRGRRLENVDREVRTLHDRFRPRTIAILDRVFDFDPGRAKALLRGWIGMRLGVTWSFPHGLRGDRIDSELAQLLRQAGVKAVHLPIGSASPRIQQLLGSNLDLAGLERGIQHLADEGIH
ncbi:MAG TPA: hypothetical protein PLJ12_07090, partial [Planctomycetota bacterium]|nr:hypothetical protein [Planctomycetota bacterium]